MEKFISFEKLSKKKQRELNRAKRGSWYGLNPVTRKPENSKAYNRRKAQKWSDDFHSEPFAMVGKVNYTQTTAQEIKCRFSALDFLCCAFCLSWLSR